MPLILTENSKQVLAQSFTELAIQNGMFYQEEDPAKTAQEIAKFFNAMTDSLGVTPGK